MLYEVVNRVMVNSGKVAYLDYKAMEVDVLGILGNRRTGGVSFDSLKGAAADTKSATTPLNDTCGSR